VRAEQCDSVGNNPVFRKVLEISKIMGYIDIFLYKSFQMAVYRYCGNREDFNTSILLYANFVYHASYVTETNPPPNFRCSIKSCNVRQIYSYHR
jgi:hypothetical protein